MKQVLIFLWLSSLLTYAQSLDDEIAAMLKAPPAQRYRLMNAIKRKIIKLKAQERRKAIEKLKQASLSQTDDNKTKHTKAFERQTSYDTNHSRNIFENGLDNTIEMRELNEIDIDTVTHCPEVDHED